MNRILVSATAVGKAMPWLFVGLITLSLAQPAMAATPDPTASPAVSVTSAPTESPTPIPIVKPGKVQGLAIGENSLLSLTLNWLPPVENGSQPVVDYKITYRFDAFTGTSVWKHDPLLTPSVTIPDLPLGTGFTFSVRAITANATGNAVSIHVVTPKPDAPTGLSNSVQAQYNFLAKSWNARSAGHFGYIPGRDCANWASQSLLVRGHKPTPKWSPRISRTIPFTKAWVSSTSLHDFLLSRKRAVLLTAAQSDQVVIGDIVQFDWWNTGAQEHTGVVTHIEQTANGPKIYYASHTAHGMWWSVDRSISVLHPGATVSYLHLNY